MKQTLPFPLTQRDAMIWIAGGDFMMGSDHHYREEAPAHRASVSGFWIDPTPVTNAEFERFVVEQIRQRGGSEAKATLSSAWERLPVAKQATTMRRLLQRVDYDGVAQQVTIRFISSDARVSAKRPSLPHKEKML